ncbi:MAG: bacterial Ig-like domain-containing protein [Clostridia bacterium]|nr:bacterial Ig-like domain-containing protein [Clostridia bacterium]
MITVTKAHLNHPDFDADFVRREIEALEALMDAELEKGDAADFDLIDACADAVNALRSGAETAALPPTSHKAFLRAIGVRRGDGARIALAAGIAAALLLAAVSQLRTSEEITVAKAVSQKIAALFTQEPLIMEETTAAPVPATTAPATEPTTAAPTVTGIRVTTGVDWKTEYAVGEPFSADGLTVTALLSDGTEQQAEFSVTVADDFGKAAGDADVTVTAAGLTETLSVRVLDTVETPKLNSIYAVFPEDFDFTVADASAPDLTGMKVYAVYSNGDEQPLTAADYTVTYDDVSQGRETKTMVTLAYEDCEASFILTQERKG